LRNQDRLFLVRPFKGAAAADLPGEKVRVFCHACGALNLNEIKLLQPTSRLFATGRLGMLVFYSSEHPEPYNKEQPPETKATDGLAADKALKAVSMKSNQENKWYYGFVERPTDWLLVLFTGLLVFATVERCSFPVSGLLVSRVNLRRQPNSPLK
jgi:hypothetical protein